MAVTGTNITITTRLGKDSALTFAELDANQTGLKSAIENHGHNDFAATAHNHAGLLDEPAHDLLDHAGLTGVLAIGTTGTTAAAGNHNHTGVYAPVLGTDDNYVTDAEKTALHSHSNKTTLDKVTEAAGLPLWNGATWPGGAGGGTGDMLASVYDPDADGHISYNDLANKPTIPTIPTLATVATSGSYTDLSNVPTTFTPTAHSHAQSDVIGLVTALAGKQAALVSGTNIKTINGASVLGSGDIVISGGGGASVQQTTVTLAQNASTNITATSVLSVYEQVVGASLIPAMTSNTTPYGTVSADTCYSGSYAYSAVDGSTASAWNSLFTASPHWLKYDGVVGTAIQYSIDCYNHAAQAPKDFELRHSADGGTTWTTLDSRTNITNWTSKNTYTISTPATTPNGIYQLYITAGITSEIVIHEFSLLGAPTYKKLLSTDYAVTRFAATKNQIQTITRLKTGTAVMVIDYI